ncbi:hypothetical protein [Streptacidiphilus sp. PAMC 29251]
MKPPTDAVLTGMAQVIDALVLAVRTGDAPRTEELLFQFCRLAEFEDLLRLRTALEADLWRH